MWWLQIGQSEVAGFRLCRFRVLHTVWSLRLFLREFVRILSKGLLIWINQCLNHHVCVAIISRNNYKIAELLKCTALHPSFNASWHKFQQEDKRGIPSRNNSNNDNQQNEQLHRTEESHNAHTMFQAAITSSRTRIIAARISRAQNTDLYNSLTTCFNRTMATCNTYPHYPHYLYSYLFIIRKFIQLKTGRVVKLMSRIRP